MRRRLTLFPDMLTSVTPTVAEDPRGPADGANLAPGMTLLAYSGDTWGGFLG